MLTGVVTLAADAELPLAALPQTNPASASSDGACPALDEHDRRLVALNAQGRGLSPIHVAVTGMRTNAGARKPVVREVFVDGCRLRPGLLGVMRGDTVRVTNRSPQPFVPTFTHESYGTALARGESRDLDIDYIGTRTVQCKLGAFCGQTFVVSLAHDLQGVTDEQGRFRIEGIPLGGELTVHAWHPLFQVASQSFTLSASDPAATLTLSLKPLSGAPALAKPPPTRGKREVVPD